LVDRYGIPETHIFSSRTRNFKKGVLNLTENRGVDVVLNSLSGDMLTDTWSCIADFGVFVEIGSPGKYQLSMQPFERNVTLTSIDLALMRRLRPGRGQKTLQKIMAMFSSKQLEIIHPLTEVPLSELESVFRNVQSGKHTGKIVLVADETAIVPVLPSKIPALELDNAAAYIIVDKSEGLGSKIAHFLISVGANSIFFLETNSQLRDLVDDKDRLAAVKGVIHVDSIPPNSTRENNFVNEIALLDKALERSKLDFFITISAIEDALGIGSDDERTTACAWKEAFANSKTNSSTRYLSLVIGPVRENETFELPQQSPLHQVREEDVFGLLNFAIQAHPGSRGSRQIWMGVKKPKETGSEDPLLSYVAYNEHAGAGSSGKSTSLTIDKAILAADSSAKVQDLITEAVTAKIASLVAIDPRDINLDAPVATFGLDSLIAIEFKNWIGRVLMAPIQTSEILDVPDIIALAALIAERSTILKKPSTNGSRNGSRNGHVEAHVVSSQNGADEQVLQKPVLPKLPLNDLNSFINSYFESVRGYLNKEELERFVQAIVQFKEPGGIGEKLQGRLAARAQDPKLENWNAEQLVRESFLDRRYSVVPYSSFFFTHPLSKHKYGQAEKAAVIAKTAFEFKQKIEAGKVEQQILNERPLCMRLSKWIFNTGREPRLGSDEIYQFPGYNHIIVFRRGHAFKVELRENGQNVPYTLLRDTFQEIINTVGETDWAGVLTSDDRDKWAKVGFSILCPFLDEVSC